MYHIHIVICLLLSYLSRDRWEDLMNPSSQMKSLIPSKLFLTLVFGLMLLVPIIVTAQDAEATEDPQADPVVTEVSVEEPETVEETVIPTEEPVQIIEETVVAPEATEATPEGGDSEAPGETEPVATEAPATDVDSETTEEPAVDTVETEVPDAVTGTETETEPVVETEAPVVVETPVEITELSEDFEAWTGENWTVTDWTVTSVDDSLALVTSVEDASAQVISLDWTNYSITVDVKVEAGNTLSLSFADYTLLVATDGRNRLSQGDAIVATSPASETTSDTTVWHTFQIDKAGPNLTVTMDDIPQYTVQTTDDTPLGIFAFTATSDQGAAIDNLVMAEVDEPTTVEIVSTPTPEPEVVIVETTEEPDLLAEATEEVDPLAETTEEPDLLAEATEEADPLAETTEEPDLLAEATEEPDIVAAVEEPSTIVTNLITDDFEGDLAAWATTGSIVELAEGNHALLLNNGELSPATPIETDNVMISGQANIQSDGETAGKFSTTLGAYTVEISTTGVVISEGETVLAATESAIDINTWFDFAVDANANGITVSVNGATVAEYVAEIIIDSNFVIATNTSTMFDNISIDTLTIEEPLATPTPEVLTEEAQSKLGGIAGKLITAYIAGGEEAVAAFLADNTDADELGRVLVDILASSDSDGATVAQIVTDAGGEVTRIHVQSIEAYVDVSTILAVANNENVRFIRNVNRAVSTGPVGDNGLAGVDRQETWTEAYNLLSIEEWHLAGVTGQDVKVGVVDIGFSNADSATARNGNLSCLASTTPLYNSDTGLGTSDHGTKVVEVICDMAPNAEVYMFRADSAASLRDAVSTARSSGNRMDVLIIALDLGVNTSAGGGQSGNIDTNVYGEIEAAKNAGMVIVVAAGNNNKRMLVLEITNGAGASSITVDNVTAGDMVKVGWNDFNNASIVANIGVSLGGVSDSSSNPELDPLQVTANANGSLTLTITPSSVNQATYLQVQLVPADPASDLEYNYTLLSMGANTTDLTHDDNIGNLGRPADSDHVISVGAICARDDINATRWEYSSNGPRFNANGTPLNLTNAPDGPVTQSEAKPTIMSYAFVSYSDVSDTAGIGGGESPEDNLVGCTDGFGGTSAAAAHVAGMTALIMSNDDNESFADLNEANATSSQTFENIRTYLQARSVDLPFGSEANGFDMDYGAGLSILGAPSYDLDNTVNMSSGANSLPANCNTDNTYYVGQQSLDNTTLSGNISTPFTSIAAALNANLDDANDDTDPQCVIVMPGEYVSPILVENTYDETRPLLVTGYSDVHRTDVGDVIFWLRSLYRNPSSPSDYTYFADPDLSSAGTYRRRAGLYFGDTSANVEVSGFTFVPARFFTDSSQQSYTVAPSAVVMDNASGTTISNSQFGKLTLNGVTYPGWFNIDATPIQVLNGTVGGRVENNVFNENSVNSIGFYPTVAVVNSGEMDDPIVVKGNEIFGNRAAISDLGEWSSILYSNGSYIDIINNAISDNEGGTIVKIETTNPIVADGTSGIAATHDRRARLVGNVFLENETISDIGLKQPGALINARYAPMIYIINNTIVGNVIGGTNPFGELISRGNANSATGPGAGANGGSNAAGWDFWEIHNNVIYNNDYYHLVGDTEINQERGCRRIPNDNSNSLLDAFSYDHTNTFNPTDDVTDPQTFNDRGAQNNWIVSNTHGSISEFGACQNIIATAKTTPGTVAHANRNIIDSDSQPIDTRSSDDSLLAQDGDFQGLDTTIVQPYTTSDWEYYALVDTLIDEDNGNLNEYSDGIDAAGDNWLLDDGGSGDANDPYMDGADIGFDINGTKRPLDVNGWEISWISNDTLTPPQGVSTTASDDFTVDIGAFEYSPLQFETQNDEYYNADLEIEVGDITHPAVTDTLREDLEGFENPIGTPAEFVTFDLSTVVTGGFGKLTFTIQQDPNNYGTQCGDQFENTRGLVIRGNGFDELLDYCPPLNFYTNDADVFTNNDYVNFKINVTDEAGAFASGEIRFTIDPDQGGTGDDADFSEDGNIAIGDGMLGGAVDDSDVFEVVTTLGGDLTVRLRPYVRFGNFFFSENGNNEYQHADGRKYVDYPFTYSNINVVQDPPGVLLNYDDSSVTDFGIISFEMSDSLTGKVTVTYDVTDAGGTSTGNTLEIRSVSIVPDNGLHDDTSFIWNYSDGATSDFFTKLSGFEEADVPVSGDWIAKRELGAINETLHTTSTMDDTATFRFIGSGFTVYMRGGNATINNPFALKIYDEISGSDVEVDILNLATNADWVADTGNINKLEVDINDGVNLFEDVNENATQDDLLVCNTRAGIDPLDATQLVHNLDIYTITCDGLTPAAHTIQIINKGTGAISVDAFSIINNGTDFTDAGPIGPGFHDIDTNALQIAFGLNGSWTEDITDPSYSNGIAMALAGSATISFEISDASGFAIGTTYRDSNSSFNICVNEVGLTPITDGVCSEFNDNIGSTATGIHAPFFGLNPENNYTITLENLPSGFIFDDLVVFGELVAPTEVLELGETSVDDLNLNLVFGEPFGDDWVESNGNQTINENRSAIGPFITFQMEDNVDTIGIKALVPAPPVTCPRRGPCPVPDPSGFSGLAVCINRDLLAETAGEDFGNCIIIDTLLSEYDGINSTNGNVEAGGAIQVTDDIIFVSEDLFETVGTEWDPNSSGEPNTVEIFSLHPDSQLQVTSIILMSSESGLGEGTYASTAPGFSYVEYDHATNGYSDVEVDDPSGAFTAIEITACVAFRKGTCTATQVIGNPIQTNGIGNAVLFSMTGSGVSPQFTVAPNQFARICFQEDSATFDAFTTNAEFAAEIQSNGNCQTLDTSQDIPFIHGIGTDVQHVMIELLPSSMRNTVACTKVGRTTTCSNVEVDPVMNFDGVIIKKADWQSLDPLAAGDRYETSYLARFNDNQFAYTGSWSTNEDSDSTHSGTSYDETNDDASASIMFQTTDANAINIVRDLRTEVASVCPRRQPCTPGVDGFSPIKVCVAPVADSTNQKCSVYSSDGNETQASLPISLTDDFSTGDFIVSITSLTDEGFVIDAVDVMDTTLDKMTAGIYQEDSNLIAYTIGQSDLIKDPSFESNNPLLDNDGGEDWDWSISSGINASFAADHFFVGSQSLQVDSDDTDIVASQVFDLAADNQYTVLARVYVVSGTVEMQLDNIGFTQANQYTGKWELLRHTFAPTSDITDQLEIVTTSDNTTFYVDDVHVYQDGSWDISPGGLTDGQVAAGNDYGSKAAFMFNGTGFTVKLGSNESSGETRICYDDDLGFGSPNCFTYDNEQGKPDPICTGSGRRVSCYVPSAAVNNGHTIVGLTMGDYAVSVEQLDNGLSTAQGPDVCSGSGRRQVCVPGNPPNSANDGPTSVKLDYIQIYDDSDNLPVIGVGTYNENHQIDGELGIQYFPREEWAQQAGDNATDNFSDNSYYQVSNASAVGSLFAINVSGAEPITVIIDINQVNEKADRILACTDEIDGELSYNGSKYEVVGTTDCIITDAATTQSHLVFNQNNLPALAGGSHLLSIQSLTNSEFIVDGYQVLVGTLLTEGFYEENIGSSPSGSIITISNISGTNDWSSVQHSSYSTNSALASSISGTSVSFEFEGTGVSLFMGQGRTVTTCVSGRRGAITCTDSSEPLGQVSITLETDPGGICSGSCHDEVGELAPISGVQVEPGTITIAGLPSSTYTLTLTTHIDESLSENIVLDAIEVFGDLQLLGSLYDDAQIDVNGMPLLSFVPTQSTWSTSVANLSGKFLNNSYHVATKLGATVSFEVVDGTEAILLYDGNPPLPTQTCIASRRGTCTAYSALPYPVASSSNVEVCWSDLAAPGFSRKCVTVEDLDDGSTYRRVDAPDGAGNYNVSITNKASNEPLIIDAIQVVEAGLMTEGLYEEDSDKLTDGSAGTYTPITNTNASDDRVISLDQNDQVEFTFEGIAFSVQLVEDHNSISGTSSDFDICAYPGNSGDTTCADLNALNDVPTPVSSTLTSVSYAGFHNTAGADNANGRWTVVITNNDTDPLLIDRVDILGNNNDLTISDKSAYEAGDPQIRYLPFGSWTETTEFKDGSPSNDQRFDTSLSGAIAYFEFVDDGSGFDLEYVRQFQDFIPESAICIASRRGRCTQYAAIPAVPAFAAANICYGEVGDPNSKACITPPVTNGNNSEINEGLSIFQFSSFNELSASPDCTNGCWVYIEYSRDIAADSLLPLDFIRLYDPASTLTAGVYQENHANINNSGGSGKVTDANAKLGFYDRISGTVGESYFYFPFEGTGLSIRTFAGSNAEDISLCLIDYTGGSIPTLPADLGNSVCMSTFSNVQETDGFITRTLHGLDHNAEYMAIIKMDSADGSTVLGLDQVTIFEKPWFDESDFTDSTYLNLLEGGGSYPISFKNRNSEKRVQFLGDWATISEQILIGYANARKRQGPIYLTEEGDRGLSPGATALWRGISATAVSFDVEIDPDTTGSFEVCATPLIDSGGWKVDISSGSVCQTFTQSGRSTSSFSFSDTNDTPYVFTLQLLTEETWINLHQVSLFDVSDGLGEGRYDNASPGIKYNGSYDAVVDEGMEAEAEDGQWDKIGSSTETERGGGETICVPGRRGPVCTFYPETSTEVCVAGRRGRITCSLIPEPVVNGIYQPPIEGDFMRKVVGNIGQGIEYVGDGSGFALENDKRYTVTANVFITEDSIGGVMMRIVSGTETIAEIAGEDLSTTNKGAWQTIRTDFTTEMEYPTLNIELVAINGRTTFFVDEVIVSSGGLWTTDTVPLGPDVCSGSRRRVTCVPGDPLFDAYQDGYTKSTTPGASFTFDFVGTGFEVGLVAGNATGEVEVCYHPESDDTDVNCFLYSQDDGVPVTSVTCVSGRRGPVCSTTVSSTLDIAGRSVVGLPYDKWTVTVYEIDDRYLLADTSKTRYTAEVSCTSGKRAVCTLVTNYTGTLFGLDYVNIFNDTDAPTVPIGAYVEDAKDTATSENYLRLYREEDWTTFNGNSSFTNKAYTAPANGAVPSEKPGPIALLKVNTPVTGTDMAVVFQFGGDSSGFTQSLLLCVDETNGEIGWDGTEFVLSNSDNCKLLNNAGVIGQASITSDTIDVLGNPGPHTVTISALLPGKFRIDGYQVFEDRALTAGLHNASLPQTILDFGPEAVSSSATCDPMNEWCFTNTKVALELVCTSYRRGACRATGLQPITTSPYIGSAAITGKSGSTINFVAEGTGFSIISDVSDSGLDFRVCYKLASSDTGFPAHNTVPVGDELEALNGYGFDELNNPIPVLVSEGAILCELLTTDTDNWDVNKNRPLSSGAQYGFSYYGLPFDTYEVQIMVTTPQASIAELDVFVLDAINVFSNPFDLAALTPGLVDDSSANISFEPNLFWDSNIKDGAYLDTESTSDHAGAISQFRADGNTVVLYQSVGDYTSEAQICLVISNENIHCTVEAERQTRLARQVTTFTQTGALVTGVVCAPGRRGRITCSTTTVVEDTAFTPVVFYGLGDESIHKLIVENRVHGEIFNMDAIQVID